MSWIRGVSLCLGVGVSAIVMPAYAQGEAVDFDAASKIAWHKLLSHTIYHLATIVVNDGFPGAEREVVGCYNDVMKGVPAIGPLDKNGYIDLKVDFFNDDIRTEKIQECILEDNIIYYFTSDKFSDRYKSSFFNNDNHRFRMHIFSNLLSEEYVAYWIEYLRSEDNMPEHADRFYSIGHVIEQDTEDAVSP